MILLSWFCFGQLFLSKPASVMECICRGVDMSFLGWIVEWIVALRGVSFEKQGWCLLSGDKDEFNEGSGRSIHQKL